MKKIFLYSIITLVFLVASCSDFLDRSPSGTVDGSTLSNKKGLEMLLSGLYSSLYNDSYFDATLSNYAYGDVMGGDANKGSTSSDQPPFTNLETYVITTDNSYLRVKWGRTYDGVSRSNDVLKFIENLKNEDFMKEMGVEKDKYTEAIAQARFFRGFWHFEAVKNFGAAVPYVSLEDYLKDVNPKVSNVDESGNYIFIWDKLIDDLDFAYKNLPDIWPADPGKVNKWAAAAYLAKAKIYQSSPYNGGNGSKNRWDEVKALLEEIMANGKDGKGTKFKLADTYEELWVAGKSDWTGESVFDIQMSIVGEIDQLSSINGAPNIAPPGGLGTEGWGFYQPSNDLVNAHIVDNNGLPLFDKSFRDKKPLTAADGSSINYPQTDLKVYTDPRLDISTGRFQTPYWDWTILTGTDNWVRDVSNGGYYLNKKNIPKRSDKQTGLSHPQRTASSTKNFHLIRYADVLLWYAEALIETGHHSGALSYVNQVRTRAANYYVKAAKMLDAKTMIPDTSSYVLDDKVNTKIEKNAAANYRIGLYPASQFSTKEGALEALRFERRIEFAMEGQRWYDLARWGIIGQELTDYINFEKNYLVKYSSSYYHKDWVTLPIPADEIVTMQGVLVQNKNWLNK